MTDQSVAVALSKSVVFIGFFFLTHVERIVLLLNLRREGIGSWYLKSAVMQNYGGGEVYLSLVSTVPWRVYFLK